MKNGFFLFFILFSSFLSAANLEQKNEGDSIVYYKDLSNQLLVKIGINSSFSNLTIKNTHDNGELIIKPLGQVSLAAAVNYKWFGIGVGIGLPPNQLEKNKKGNTSKLDLQFNLYTKKFGGDVFFQNYNGFHLSNPGNNWKSDTLPQLGKMQQYAVGATAFYIFNHKKFSYQAPYVRNTIQMKSAGSWLGGLFFNLDAAAVDGGFVPFDSLLLTLRDSFPVYAYSSSSFGLSFGYSYTLVISPSFFFNATLMPGFGLKNVSMETYKFENGKVITNAVSTSSGASGRVMFRASLGYQRNTFLMGATFHSSQGTIAIEHFEFKPGLGSFKFFIAKRFGQKN
jgi:hypothetical protein